MEKRSGWMLLLAGLLYGCDCGDDSSADGDADADSDADADADSDADTDRDGGLLCGDRECVANEECVEDRCRCPSGVRCGEALARCCAAGEVCYLGDCTEPGEDCEAPGDCPPDQYCEMAIGACLPTAGREECRYEPPVGVFAPELYWSWPRDDTPNPEVREIISTPLVVPRAGGDPDRLAEPVVVFLAGAGFQSPELRIVSGVDGADVTHVRDVFQSQSQIALGDLDGDGTWEVVGILRGDSAPRCPYDGATNGALLAAYSPDGTRVWTSDVAVSYGAAAPVIADLDADGSAEVVVGRSVFDADGSHRWTGEAGEGWDACIQAGAYTIVADVTGDGAPEILGGNTAYSTDGDVVWTAAVPDGFDATADFDGDGSPEIVIVHGTPNGLDIVDASGDLVCHGAAPVAANIGGGPPSVADFDADGAPEVGVVWPLSYAVYEGDCSLAWSIATTDASGQTSSSVFDFEGDGAAEVVYTDELSVHVFAGVDGTELFTLPHSSATGLENPVVADIDGDGHTEILAVGQQTVDPSLRAFRDTDRNWVGSRRVWNQHSYHVTNVEESGAIPAVEEDNWTTPGLNDYRRNAAGDRAFDVPDLALVDLRDVDDLCGAAMTFLVRIVNEGAIAVAAGVVVRFEVDLEDGSHLVAGETTTTGLLLPGESEEVSVVWDVPDGVSEVEVTALVDPPDAAEFGAVRECDEANNRAGPVPASCEDVF